MIIDAILAWLVFGIIVAGVIPAYYRWIHQSFRDKRKRFCVELPSGEHSVIGRRDLHLLQRHMNVKVLGESD